MADRHHSSTARTGSSRPARQRADYWMERGAADALVRLFGSRRLRPTVTFADAAKIAGVSERGAREAIARVRSARRPPARRRDAPHPAPPGTKWCGYGGHFPPVAEFAPNRSATTGLQSWCRACMVLARREQRQRDRECAPDARQTAAVGRHHRRPIPRNAPDRPDGRRRERGDAA